MSTWQTARRALTVARGLRHLTRHPVSLATARATVTDEMRGRDRRFLRSVDELVWPFPASPTRRLFEAVGIEAGDVRAMVTEHGLTGALGMMRDLGVHVSYEEYHGRVDARRGSAILHFTPADFFNPVAPADYLASTGGSRSAGTPVELSFAWQRRQGVQRAIQYDMVGVAGAPTGIWLPVFPSAAGYGAVMKNAAGGNRPERWWSQIPVDLKGIAAHKQLANRAIPAMNALVRTGLPAPEHVPTADPEPVVSWLRESVDRDGAAVIVGYASSITAAARWATEHGIDLSGVAAFPASEPVTAGKLAVMRAAGMRAHPMYAFVPEGTVAITCPHGGDEDYHLWSHDHALVTRRRSRGDGTDVDALCWTSLSLDAPRVMINVENDDFGEVRHDVDCSCALDQLGLRTRVARIRGISKVVAAGISLEGSAFDRLTESALPSALGGGPGDYQFVEDDTHGSTVIQLRIHPRVGPVDESAALAVVRKALESDEYGLLASSVWGDDGHVRVVRDAPLVTRAGKQLAYERLLPSSTQPSAAGAVGSSQE